MTLRDGAELAGPVGLDAAQVRVAVTALGHGAALLDVQVSEVATGGLDHLATSRLGVVRVALAESDTLSHLDRGIGTREMGSVCGWREMMRNEGRTAVAVAVAAVVEVAVIVGGRWQNGQYDADVVETKHAKLLTMR